MLSLFVLTEMCREALCPHDGQLSVYWAIIIIVIAVAMSLARVAGNLPEAVLGETLGSVFQASSPLTLGSWSGKWSKQRIVAGFGVWGLCVGSSGVPEHFSLVLGWGGGERMLPWWTEARAECWRWRGISKVRRYKEVILPKLSTNIRYKSDVFLFGKNFA